MDAPMTQAKKIQLGFSKQSHSSNNQQVHQSLTLLQRLANFQLKSTLAGSQQTRQQSIGNSQSLPPQAHHLNQVSGSGAPNSGTIQQPGAGMPAVLHNNIILNINGNTDLKQLAFHQNNFNQVLSSSGEYAPEQPPTISQAEPVYQETSSAFEFLPSKPQSHLVNVNQGSIHGRKIDAGKQHLSGWRESKDYESENQKAAKSGRANEIKQILGNMVNHKAKGTKKHQRSNSKNTRITPKGVMQKAIEPTRSAKKSMQDSDFKENRGLGLIFKENEQAQQYNTAQPVKKLIPSAAGKRKMDKPPAKASRSGRPLSQTRTSIHRPSKKLSETRKSSNIGGHGNSSLLGTQTTSGVAATQRPQSKPSSNLVKAQQSSHSGHLNSNPNRMGSGQGPITKRSQDPQMCINKENKSLLNNFGSGTRMAQKKKSLIPQPPAAPQLISNKRGVSRHEGMSMSSFSSGSSKALPSQQNLQRENYHQSGGSIAQQLSRSYFLNSKQLLRHLSPARMDNPPDNSEIILGDHPGSVPHGPTTSASRYQEGANSGMSQRRRQRGRNRSTAVASMPNNLMKSKQRKNSGGSFSNSRSQNIGILSQNPQMNSILVGKKKKQKTAEPSTQQINLSNMTQKMALSSTISKPIAPNNLREKQHESRVAKSKSATLSQNNQSTQEKGPTSQQTSVKNRSTVDKIIKDNLRRNKNKLEEEVIRRQMEQQKVLQRKAEISQRNNEVRMINASKVHKEVAQSSAGAPGTGISPPPQQQSREASQRWRSHSCIDQNPAPPQGVPPPPAKIKPPVQTQTTRETLKKPGSKSEDENLQQMKLKIIPNTTTNQKVNKPRNFIDEINQLTHEVEKEIEKTRPPKEGGLLNGSVRSKPISKPPKICNIQTHNYTEKQDNSCLSENQCNSMLNPMTTTAQQSKAKKHKSMTKSVKLQKAIEKKKREEFIKKSLEHTIEVDKREKIQQNLSNLNKFVKKNLRQKSQQFISHKRTSVQVNSGAHSGLLQKPKKHHKKTATKQPVLDDPPMIAGIGARNRLFQESEQMQDFSAIMEPDVTRNTNMDPLNDFHHYRKNDSQDSSLFGDIAQLSKLAHNPQNDSSILNKSALIGTGKPNGTLLAPGHKGLKQKKRTQNLDKTIQPKDIPHPEAPIVLQQRKNSAAPYQTSKTSAVKKTKPKPSGQVKTKSHPNLQQPPLSKTVASQHNNKSMWLSQKHPEIVEDKPKRIQAPQTVVELSLPESIKSTIQVPNMIPPHEVSPVPTLFIPNIDRSSKRQYASSNQRHNGSTTETRHIEEMHPQEELSPGQLISPISASQMEEQPIPAGVEKSMKSRLTSNVKALKKLGIGQRLHDPESNHSSIYANSDEDHFMNSGTNYGVPKTKKQKKRAPKPQSQKEQVHVVPQPQAAESDYIQTTDKRSYQNQHSEKQQQKRYNFSQPSGGFTSHYPQGAESYFINTSERMDRDEGFQPDYPRPSNVELISHVEDDHALPFGEGATSEKKELIGSIFPPSESSSMNGGFHRPFHSKDSSSFMSPPQQLISNQGSMAYNANFNPSMFEQQPPQEQMNQVQSDKKRRTKSPKKKAKKSQPKPVVSKPIQEAATPGKSESYSPGKKLSPGKNKGSLPKSSMRQNPQVPRIDLQKLKIATQNSKEKKKAVEVQQLDNSEQLVVPEKPLNFYPSKHSPASNKAPSDVISSYSGIFNRPGLVLPSSARVQINYDLLNDNPKISEELKKIADMKHAKGQEAITRGRERNLISDRTYNTKMKQIEKWVTVAHNKISSHPRCRSGLQLPFSSPRANQLKKRSGRKAAYLENPDAMMQEFEEQTQRTQKILQAKEADVHSTNGKPSARQAGSHRQWYKGFHSMKQDTTNNASNAASNSRRGESEHDPYGSRSIPPLQTNNFIIGSGRSHQSKLVDMINEASLPKENSMDASQSQSQQEIDPNDIRLDVSGLEVKKAHHRVRNDQRRSLGLEPTYTYDNDKPPEVAENKRVLNFTDQNFDRIMLPESDTIHASDYDGNRRSDLTQLDDKEESFQRQTQTEKSLNRSQSCTNIPQDNETKNDDLSQLENELQNQQLRDQNASSQLSSQHFRKGSPPLQINDQALSPSDINYRFVNDIGGVRDPNFFTGQFQEERFDPTDGGSYSDFDQRQPPSDNKSSPGQQKPSGNKRNELRIEDQMESSEKPSYEKSFSKSNGTEKTDSNIPDFLNSDKPTLKVVDPEDDGGATVPSPQTSEAAHDIDKTQFQISEEFQPAQPPAAEVSAPAPSHIKIENQKQEQPSLADLNHVSTFGGDSGMKKKNIQLKQALNSTVESPNSSSIVAYPVSPTSDSQVQIQKGEHSIDSDSEKIKAFPLHNDRLDSPPDLISPKGSMQPPLLDSSSPTAEGALDKEQLADHITDTFFKLMLQSLESDIENLIPRGNSFGEATEGQGSSVQQQLQQRFPGIKFFEKKGIKTDLFAIEKYVDEVLEEVKLKRDEFMSEINRPLSKNPLQSLFHMQNSEIGTYEHFQSQLPPVLSLDLYLKLEKRRKESRDGPQNDGRFDFDITDEELLDDGVDKNFLAECQHIHNKVLFDCINDSLQQFRPHGKDGAPMLWNRLGIKLKASEQFTLEEMFELTKHDLFRMAIMQAGTLPRKEFVFSAQFDEELFAEIREKKLATLLCREIVETEPQWLKWDFEEAQTKIDLADMVLESLVSETMEFLNKKETEKKTPSQQMFEQIESMIISRT